MVLDRILFQQLKQQGVGGGTGGTGEGCQQLPFLLSYMSAMKLSNWARKQGIRYLTAWRWFQAGKLPVPARPETELRKP
jgi:hypothetical protein